MVDQTEDLIAHAVVCPSGNWYFVAATREGAEQKLYINGIPATTRTVRADIGSPYQLVIRRSFRPPGFNECFSGCIDQIRIYKTGSCSITKDFLCARLCLSGYPLCCIGLQSSRFPIFAPFKK